MTIDESDNILNTLWNVLDKVKSQSSGAAASPFFKRLAAELENQLANACMVEVLKEEWEEKKKCKLKLNSANV